MRKKKGLRRRNPRLKRRLSSNSKKSWLRLKRYVSPENDLSCPRLKLRNRSLLYLFLWIPMRFFYKTISIVLGMKKAREREKKATAYGPLLPRRPERPEERRWPSPTPMPLVPTEDTNRILKQILDRLDAIEKRLDKIEKLLTGRQPAP